MLDKKKKTIVIIAIVALVAMVVCFGSFLIAPNKNILAMSELETMATAIRNSYKNSPAYWGLDSKFVINNNIANDVKDSKIVNVLGKNTFVGYGFDATTLMPGSKTFDIVYKDLSKSECIALASFEFSEEQKLSLVAIILRIDNKEEEFNWGGENKLPLSVNIAKRFCKEKNDILWRFE